MKFRTTLRLTALMLSMCAGVPAMASGGDDFGRNVVLPAAADLIGIARVADITAAAVVRPTILRITLELENGRWVYRSESAVNSARGGVRLDINATTGAVGRTKSGKLGGSEQREAVSIQNRASEIALTFAQAADAAVAAAPGLVTDVRLQVEGRALVYKVTTYTQTSRSEVRLNPKTGAVLRVSTEGTPSGDGQSGGSGGSGDDSSGGSGGSSGGGSSGGSGGGSGSGSGGGSGGGNTDPRPTGQAAVLAAAVDTALSGQPAATQPIEVQFKRRNMVTSIEVLIGTPGREIGQEVRVNPVSGAASRNSEALGADGTVLNAFNRALAGQTAVGFGRAMQAAADATGAEVSRAEIGTRGATPIYEVKVLVGGREVSVKVNAVTGSILP